MIKKHILRYGLLKRLKDGMRIKIRPTYRCTLDCAYCANRVIDGTRPVCKEEIRLADWQRIITHHPRKVREVVISGGEPMCYSEFVPLVDWLTSEGYFVTVFTNLTLTRGLQMKPSYKIRLAATCHRSCDLRQWKQHLLLYRNWFRVDVEEVDTRMIPGSIWKSTLPCADHSRYFTETPCGRTGGMCQCIGDVYSPDGVLHASGMEELEYLARKAGRS